MSVGGTVWAFVLAGVGAYVVVSLLVLWSMLGAAARADRDSDRLMAARGLPPATGGTLARMAIAIDSSKAFKLVDNVLSDRTNTVRNNGPDPIGLSTDGTIAAGAGFSVAAAGTQVVDLEVGQALYARCAAGKTATVDVI